MSSAHVTSNVRSADAFTLLKPSVCPSSVCRQLQTTSLRSSGGSSERLHTLHVVSWLHVNTKDMSSAMSTPYTSMLWPSNDCANTHSCLPKFRHTRHVVSALTVAMKDASGVTAQKYSWSVWPVSTATQRHLVLDRWKLADETSETVVRLLPVLVSSGASCVIVYTRHVLSALAETMTSTSAIATPLTPSAWSSRTPMHCQCPLTGDQIRHVASSLAVITSCRLIDTAV
mmetsp:Transcript_16743/g.47515  ORF Transcript_16743/g.47515 Transcript_16743/m.47515 type:complete len:229 (-) Transcript_16743:159-845(-)